MNFKQVETQMTLPQVVALAACMLSVAHVDGVRPEEIALIKQFYDGAETEGGPAFDVLDGSTAKADEALAGAETTEDFIEHLLLLCLMTGYADGHLSDAEYARVLAIGAQVGVGGERVAELRQSVKDTLLQSLSGLPAPESVAALASEL
ncbi:hypothetical protein [Ottowia sp.]|uniref:hypothetical protein n=1 Tax=Ottowia sp. TaxID=1898956 RepID=UPI0025EC985E|nr:hypothetical protein [Ottowia sp.]MBK6616525.1 hypothetical protein [Ottowia sp.]